ncbi:hypothetical protein NG796_17005 [Laspinema sp. A4]|uniref:hypothetical protein n=1 Tax=Laspinema sp. D2d TaxID=2953686 RepID=UPI0021BAE740|nr:hypothetical protein [Laspinema sp. D2d]MCT7984973.1 hypothetical protein [Laspinema sp. D2d]
MVYVREQPDAVSGCDRHECKTHPDNALWIRIDAIGFGNLAIASKGYNYHTLGNS